MQVERGTGGKPLKKSAPPKPMLGGASILELD